MSSRKSVSQFVSKVMGAPAVSDLQAENRRLREQLDRLMAEARLNQDKLRRFDQIERRIISASSLADLVHILLVEYPALFELQAVTLAWVDPEYEAARLLAESSVVHSECLHFLPNELALTELYGDGKRPVLGLPAQGKFLGGLSQAPASVALLPLWLRGQLVGSLQLCSRDALRFQSGNSTDFLERLAALLAVCLDHALGTERLKLAGLTDGLTGVHNRRYFESRCTEEVLSAKRSGLPLVCVLLDVDFFKRINDNYGHPAGDAVLRYVAQLIRAQLRGSDVVARYGGEEFVVLLPATAPAAAQDLAERIRRVIAAQTMPVDLPQPLRITVSIGVAALMPGSDAAAQAQSLVQRADQALYAAKQGGRNRVMAHDAL